MSGLAGVFALVAVAICVTALAAVGIAHAIARSSEREWRAADRRAREIIFGDAKRPAP